MTKKEANELVVAVSHMVELWKQSYDELHSLRMAVLEYFLRREDGEDQRIRDVNLYKAADLIYDNGTWILKEGE